MSKELFRAKEFCFIIFSSTQHALRAEKILMGRGEDCLIIPTPREVSSSCGLAMKVKCHQCISIETFLRQEEVGIEGIYQVDAGGMHPFP